MKKNNFKLLAIPLILIVATSCAGGYYGGMYAPEGFEDPYYNNDEYLPIIENDYINPEETPTSSFTLDSSTSAYTNLRKSINSNYVQKDQIIIEQLVNYFTYDYETPTDEPVKIYNEVSACPWNKDALLASIAVKTKEIKYEETVNNNYVFLIDVSGSMISNDKLPLVKYGFNMLVDTLNEGDKVSLVTYSGSVKTELAGVNGNQKDRIKDKINSLKANGSTAGGAAIKSAYSLAKDYFIEDGNNHILMATDGDFNVGVSSFEELKELVIKEKQNYNINFSTFGFGIGNYKNDNMEALALNGNGNCYYIDCEAEAERLFTGNISSILSVVAKDAKIQVTFDKDFISTYRLIGYENKIITDEEFKDDTKDAGEIYSNKTVIAFYEINLKDAIEIDENNAPCLYETEFKYKNPTDDVLSESKIIKTNTTPYEVNPSFNYVFSSSVAEFALALRNSKYKYDASYQNVIERLENLPEVTSDPLKQEFVELVKKVVEKEIVAY